MAAALYPSRTDPSPGVPNAFQQVLMTELDFRDTRYPSISPTSVRSSQRAAAFPSPSDSAKEPLGTGTSGDQPVSQQSSSSANPDNVLRPQSRAALSDLQSVHSQPLSQSQEPARSVVSYSLPAGTTRRVVERYSLDENTQQPRTRASEPASPAAVATPSPSQNLFEDVAIRQTLSPDIIPSVPSSSPRHPSLPLAGIGANPSTSSSGFPPPIVPSSASPSYVAPVSPRHRAYPQQPTYVSQNAVPNPINPVFSNAPHQPPEEVCVECAMRDQDMADVDVTSPGVWERESDVLFEELKRRDEEEEREVRETGITPPDDPNRPRAKGGKLTEQNLRIWLSVNPREPASRQQTLYNYIRSQRTLLEAEALAHAQAAHEAKQLDSKMRDTYSRLRESSSPDSGGVRIRPPISPSTPGLHDRSHSRDVTLLENGMIVEHVDVRKEEREARERRRKEERRMRKSSRGSGVDVTSLMSTQSLVPMTDSGVGLGLRPYSHYSFPSSGGRPGSIVTDRAELPRAQSQASFSDLHSLGSASPRRSRFLGIGNFRDRWRSQDSLAPSGMSGSMVDMHVALQRESHLPQGYSEFATLRQSQAWPSAPLEPTESRQSESTRKKKKGLAKFWGMVTGSSKRDNLKQDESFAAEKADDDYPLTPPPPLSYLVNNRSGGGRHTSTPSLVSAKLGPSTPGMSPPSAPSSILPSPSSARPSNADLDFTVRVRNGGGNYEDTENDEDTIGKSQGTIQKAVVHPVTSEPDMRLRWERTPPLPNVTNLPPSREKSLPPLPGEAQAQPRFPTNNVTDPRPKTVYTFETQLPPGSAPAHTFVSPQASFRTDRRQSFGGVTSRPNLDASLVSQPNGHTLGYTQGGNGFGPRYDELGYSRGSLLLQNERPMTPTTRRKSKFNLSSLWGKKQPQENAQQFPPMRYSGSDTPEEVVANGYANSNSRDSAFSQPRISVTSRKALEDRVAQDPNFVAYRYPSNDQRLDVR